MFGSTAPAATNRFDFSGAASRPTTSLFGGTSTATTQPAFGSVAPTSSVFGGLGTTTQPATTTLFGTTPTIGAAAATQQPQPTIGAPTTSFFTPQPAAGQQSSLFGTAPASTLGGLAAPQQLQGFETGLHAFNDIFMAYNPTSPYCRFKKVFYNSVPKGTAHLHQRPPTADTRLWDQAVHHNPSPDTLTPVQATGFEDLLARLQAQRERVDVHKKTLSALEDELSTLSNQSQLETRVRLDEYRQKHAELSHRVLRIMRKLEVLQYHGVPFSAEEGALRARLEYLQAELDKPNQYKSQLAELASLVQVQSDRHVSGSETLTFDSEQQRSVYGYLEGMREALDALRGTLKKDGRDLTIMERKWKK